MKAKLRKEMNSAISRSKRATRGGVALRDKYRRRVNPKNNIRRHNLARQVDILGEAGAELRSLIGKALRPEYEVPYKLERELLDASDLNQRERRKLRKMLR